MANGIFVAQAGESTARRVGRWTLGAMMLGAGIGHLTFVRRAFRAQVPRFVPKVSGLSVDQVVVWSGAVEISMATMLLVLPRQRRVLGRVLAVFYCAILPGNIAQWVHHRSAFGLDTDAKRFGRLFGQPVLVAWALWSTGALEGKGKRGAELGDGD